MTGAGIHPPSVARWWHHVVRRHTQRIWEHRHIHVGAMRPLGRFWRCSCGKEWPA